MANSTPKPPFAARTARRLQNSLLALLFLGFLLPVSPALAIDGEDTVRSAQMRRRRGRRRRRPPRRPPPEAAEEATADGDDEGAGEGEAGAAGAAEADADGASEELAAAAGGSDAGGDDDEASTTGNLRRSNRMEFDARLVRGQTAGAGAVVLFNRGNRPLPPLTRERRGFSRQTVRDVIGSVEARQEDAPTPRRRGRRRAGAD